MKRRRYTVVTIASGEPFAASMKRLKMCNRDRRKARHHAKVMRRKYPHASAVAIVTHWQ